MVPLGARITRAAARDADVAALSAPLRLVATLVQDASQPFAAQFVGAGGLQPGLVSRCAPELSGLRTLSLCLAERKPPATACAAMGAVQQGQIQSNPVLQRA